MEIYYNGNEFFKVIENEGHRIIAEDILNEDVHTFEREGNRYVNAYFELGQAREIEIAKGKYGEICLKKECDTCQGSGVTSYVKCGMPASNCCGGCYESEECDECEGSGSIYGELEEAWD
jgi:DnaJ-class molecular chaperone